MLWTSFLGLSITLLFGFKSIDNPNEQKKDKPNFVFIAVDDLNIYTTHLGNYPGNFLEKVYPDPLIRAEVIKRLTPNLQRLANESVTFEKAYSAAPLCGPSRTALLTGIPPHVSGYYRHSQNFRDFEVLEDVVTLPQYLKAKGYFTTGIGKVFHKGKTQKNGDKIVDWPDIAYSWDHWVETHTGTTASGELSRGKVSRVETLSKYWDASKGEKYTRFGLNVVPREYSNDFNNAQHAYQLLTSGSSTKRDVHGEFQTVKLPRKKPYFLACGLFAPHLPWVVPQEYMDRFPQEEMSLNAELLKEIKEDLTDLSSFGRRVTENTEFTALLDYGISLDGEEGDINAWKAYLQAYLATVSFTDENIGYLLEGIEKSAGRDNTVLVLWSDHGYHLGDKNRTGKVTLWEAANHCNLFIKDYRKPSAGKVVKTPVSLQDLYPTITSLAGLKRPAHVYGFDISTVLEGDEPIRGPVLNTHQEDNHAIRTDTHRYIRFRNGSQELYDLTKDPFEETNLATDKNHQSTLDELDDQLNEILNKGPGMNQ